MSLNDTDKSQEEAKSDIPAASDATAVPVPRVIDDDDLEDIKDQAFHAGYKQRQEEFDAIVNFPKKIIRELRELPDMISEEQLELLQLTCDIEKNRKIIAELKDDAFNIVLSATDNGKPKYSNDKARDIAVKMWLKDNPEFCTSVDELSRLEYQHRRQQIDLAFFENKFAACRSIAMLRGVNSS